MSINSVTLTGNLGKDPVLAVMPKTDAKVLEFPLAVNERIPDGDKWIEKVIWVDIKIWGIRAEKLEHILSKGSKVAIRGRIKYSTWMKDDEKRSKLYVVADDIDLCSKQKGGNNGLSQN